MIDESIIQWGCILGCEIVFPSSDLRSILFSIEIENRQKKEKKRKFLITLGVIATWIIAASQMIGLLPIFLCLVTAGGISGGLYYLISLS